MVTNIRSHTRRNSPDFKFNINWGSVRSFPYEDSVIKILRISKDIDNLCRILYTFPPNNEQRNAVSHLKTVLLNAAANGERSDDSETDLFLRIVLPLRNPIFSYSGKHLKRVWLCLSILYKYDQRQGGYTLRDLRELAGIEEKNRTLIRKVVERMQSLGIVTRTGGIGKQPRYSFIHLWPDEVHNIAVLRETKANIRDFSKMLVKRQTKENPEKNVNWEDNIILNSISNFGNYGLEKGEFSNDLEKFVGLWPYWLGILADILLSHSNKSFGDILLRIYHMPEVRKKLEGFRKEIDRERFSDMLFLERIKGYMVMDLKKSLIAIREWNLVDDARLYSHPGNL